MASTIREFLSTPLHRKNPALGDIPMKEFVSRIPEDGIWYADTVAAVFYLGNHAVAELKNRYPENLPLGEERGLLEAYNSMLSVVALRIAQYLLVIGNRESRHTHQDSNLTDLHYEHGHPMHLVSYTQEIHGEDYTDVLTKLREEPPESTLGEYVDYLHAVFTYGRFSNSYGGGMWAKVMSPLRELVRGNITAEVMVDTAWTLAHNTGPIFNKNTLFSMDASKLQKVLDVQRAGQIPQYISEYSDSLNDHTGHLDWLVECTERALPGLSGFGLVNWEKVSELGADEYYGSEASAQKQKYGFSSYSELEALGQDAVTKIAAKKEAHKEIQIMPGLMITTTQVERAA